MRTKYIYRITIGFTLFSTALTLSACHSANSKSAEEMKSATESAERVTPPGGVAKALAQGDARTVAKNINYPLERPYPLRNIEKEADFIRFFPVMYSDSIRKLSSAKDWMHVGWRGWLLGEGGLWVSDDGSLYSWPYVSPKEKLLWQQACKQDMATLSGSMAKNWIPVFCLIGTEDSLVYRVDRRPDGNPWPTPAAESGDYRLAIYHRHDIPRGNPLNVLGGNQSNDGTMSLRFYTFRDSSGKEITYMYDDAGGGEDAYLTISTGGDSIENRPVKKVYWTDILPSN